MEKLFYDLLCYDWVVEDEHGELLDAASWHGFEFEKPSEARAWFESRQMNEFERQLYGAFYALDNAESDIPF